jgi:hypothetical protein
MIYALGIRGREFLDTLDHVERNGKRDWRLENNRLKLHFLDHEIAVTETVLALHVASQHRGWAFEWWHDPRYHVAGVLPEKVAIRPNHGRFTSLPLRPDTYAVITLDNGHRLNLFVELDRGTEPHERASLQKMLAYWDYITAAVDKHGSRAQSWRVLIVTTRSTKVPTPFSSPHATAVDSTLSSRSASSTITSGGRRKLATTTRAASSSTRARSVTSSST